MKPRDDWRGTLAAWDLINDQDKQVELLREILGMEPLTYKEAKCSLCERKFIAQYVGIKKNQHLCGYSHSEPV
tara:strand:- start:9 stop:227 length:219 start_codon:yes stop_codon:yes gene_type:complete